MIMNNSIKKTKNITKVDFLNLPSEEEAKAKIKEIESSYKNRESRNIILVVFVIFMVISFLTIKPGRFEQFFSSIVFFNASFSLAIGIIAGKIWEDDRDRLDESINTVFSEQLEDLDDFCDSIEDENIVITKALLELEYARDVFDGEEHLISKCIVYGTQGWEVEISLEGFKIENDSTLQDGEIKIDYEGKLLYAFRNTQEYERLLEVSNSNYETSPYKKWLDAVDRALQQGNANGLEIMSEERRSRTIRDIIVDDMVKRAENQNKNLKEKEDIRSKMKERLGEYNSRLKLGFINDKNERGRK